MASSPACPAPVKFGPTPPADRPADSASAVSFGSRVRHVRLPGLWKVVAVTRFTDTIRVRELCADGSLFGKVMVWTTKEIAPAAAAAATRVPIGHPSATYLVAPSPAVAPALPAELQAVKDDLEPPFPEAEAPASGSSAGAAPGRAKGRAMVVSLTLTIDGTAYDVSPQAASLLASRSFRLARTGPSGVVYDIEETVSGASCSCPDYVYRREGLDASLGCKHLRASRMMGLIDSVPISDARAAAADAREAAAALAPAELPVIEPSPPCDPLDPRTFDAHQDAEEDDAPATWDDASSWTTTEDDADPEDRWATTALEPEPEPLPGTRPAPRLAARLAGRIAALRDEGSDLAVLMADALQAGLLAEVEATDAATVAEYHDRRAALAAG